MKFWAVDLAHYFLNGHPHLSSKKYVHDRISGQTLVCVVPITIFRAGKKYLLFQQKSAMIVGLYVCRYEVFLIFIEQSSSKNSRNFSFFYVDLEWCGVFDTSRTYKFSAHMPQSHSVEKMWNFVFQFQMILLMTLTSSWVSCHQDNFSKYKCKIFELLENQISPQCAVVCEMIFFLFRA